MPSIPKWLADTMEKVAQKSFRPVVVTHVEYYHPQLKLVRFEGGITSTGFKAGNVIEFRVSERDFRHYTPSVYNPEQNTCEILFYLHNQGPGSRWAEELQPGYETKLMGPGGRMSYQSDWKKHLVFGDETSLGLMLCMEAEALKNKHGFTGIAELAQSNLEWTNLLNSERIKAVEHSPEELSNTAHGILDELKSELPETCFYLTGRAKSIQQFRKELIARGVNSKQIKTYPYWAEGKKGL